MSQFKLYTSVYVDVVLPVYINTLLGLLFVIVTTETKYWNLRRALLDNFSEQKS